MRVLIADEFEQSGRDELEAMGCEVRFAPKLKDEALVSGVEEFRPDVVHSHHPFLFCFWRIAR